MKNNAKIKLVFLILLVGFNTHAQDLNKVTLQLKWYHQFQFAGYYAAHLKGYYKESGLDVKILEGSSIRTPINEVIKGFSDFGVTGPDILGEFIKGKPVVITSVIFQHSPYVFMTLMKSNIRTVSDLYHKKVMTTTNEGSIVLQSLFLKEGITLDSVEIINNNWSIQDLINNKVDAMSVYSTIEPYQLQEMGHQIHLINPKDYGLDFYGDLIFTSTEYARNNPEIVKAFNEASNKGWSYALQNKEEVINYILTLPNVTKRGITKNGLNYEANEIDQLVRSNLVEIGHVNSGRFQSMLEIYKELNMAPKNAKIDGLIYRPINITVNEIINWIIAALGFVCSFFILIFLWNRRLSKKVETKTKELQKEVENRKTAELAAKESEEKLKLAMKSANIGLWDWDIRTKELSINERWCKLLKIDYTKLPIRQSLFDFIHPDDVESAKSAFNEDLTKDEVNRMHQVRLLKSNGEYIYVLISFKGLKNKNGIIEKLFGVFININDIKIKEVELLDISRELIRSNNELKKFAYITSHHLRAPVVNITSLLEMINRDELVGDTAILIDKLSISTWKLNETLDDLIEVVSQQTEKRKEYSLVDFKEEIERIENQIDYQIASTNALIRVNFEVGNIYYPREVMQSILYNLITNAIKYRSLNRRITIEINTRYAEDNIILEVKDNGSGIDLSRNKSKIFGLYQRFHENLEGKGIGLFIIKSQIESLKGSIYVDSQINEGTIFKIIFPKIK